MVKKAAKSWTTPQLRALLAKRYMAPTWALLHEVPNATGIEAGRTADAIAMGLWPSRGRELIGFEIKASRRDWLKERKKPAKAEAFVRYCDRWYLVCGRDVLTVDGEVPPQWGVLLPHGNGLRIEKEAPALSPVAIDRPFLAALMRRVSEAEGSHIKERLKAEFERGRAFALEGGGFAAQRTAVSYERLKKKVAEFEEKSGLQIGEYSSGAIGEHVARYMAALRNANGSAQQLRNRADSLDEAARLAREAAALLEQKP